jgi:hypothetical protein
MKPYRKRWDRQLFTAQAKRERESNRKRRPWHRPRKWRAPWRKA